MADQTTASGEQEVDKSEVQNGPVEDEEAKEKGLVEKVEDKVEEIKEKIEEKIEEVKKDITETPPEDKEEKADGPKQEETPKETPATESNGEKEKDADEKESEPDGPMTGVYLHTKSENLEQFLEEIGINWLMRKVATKTNPTMEIRQKGEEFYIRLQTGPIGKENKFTVGVPFEEKGMAGNLVKVNPRLEDDRLVQYVEPKVEGDGKPMQITRQVKEDQLIMTMEVGSIVCTRYFNRKT